jgi:hypothetical protein
LVFGIEELVFGIEELIVGIENGRGRIAASRPNQNDNPAVAVLVLGETTVTTSLAGFVGLQSRLGCCLCGVSSTDYLGGAAGNGLRFDDFTLHGRGILSQVERRWRLADGLGRFSRECGRCECENSDCRQKNLFHSVYRLSYVQY